MGKSFLEALEIFYSQSKKKIIPIVVIIFGKL